VDIVKREIVICLKTGIIYRIKPFTELNKVHQIILYGFAYLPFFTKQVAEEEVSAEYDCLAELERMRIPWERYSIIPNINGKLSPTYPKYFVPLCLIRSLPRVYLRDFWRNVLRSGI
jgi:hypothetical protein